MIRFLGSVFIYKETETERKDNASNACDRQHNYYYNSNKNKYFN